MMSGDLSELLSTRRLSVPAQSGARRYSTFLPSAGNISGVSGARRLSAFVPEAVSRRLSNVSVSLGLGRLQTQQESVVEQGKALCAMYMRSRIRLSGPYGGVNSRVNRCNNLVTPWSGSRIVFPRLSQLGRHLERARPRLYATIGRHAVPSQSSSLPGTDDADVVYAIGMELFKEDITWGKIVSIMVVCGALASEPRGNPDLVSIIEAVAALIKGPLTPWLADNGGWYGLMEHCQPSETETSNEEEAPYPTSHVTLMFLIFPLMLFIIWYFGVPTLGSTTYLKFK